MPSAETANLFSSCVNTGLITPGLWWGLVQAGLGRRKGTQHGGGRAWGAVSGPEAVHVFGYRSETLHPLQIRVYPVGSGQLSLPTLVVPNRDPKYLTAKPSLLCVTENTVRGR